MRLLDRIRRRPRELVPSPGLADQHALLDRYVAEYTTPYPYLPDPADNAVGREVLEAPRDEQAAIACAAIERLAWARTASRSSLTIVSGLVEFHSPDPHAVEANILAPLLEPLLRRKLPFTTEQLEIALRALAAAGGDAFRLPVGRVLTAAGRHVDEHGLWELRAPLGELRRAIERRRDLYADDHKALDRLRRLLGEEPTGGLPLTKREPWARDVLQDLGQMSDGHRDAWRALISHAATSGGPTPSQRWIRQAERLAAAIPPEPLAEQLRRWFALAERGHGPDGMPDGTAEVLRGLVWVAALSGQEEVVAALGRLAASAAKKIEGHGPCSVKLANASFAALAAAPPAVAVGQLIALRRRVRHASLRDRLDAAFADAAQRAGCSPAELEELAGPPVELDPDGVRRQRVGEYVGEITIGEDATVELRWATDDGKTRKTVPPTVKAEHAGELARLRGEARELRDALLAQRHRLERLLAVERTWQGAAWRERYLEHPIVGALARRLLWTVDGETVAWWDGRLVRRDGGERIASDDAEVALWHPLHDDVDAIQGWRAWLEERLITQPFKQAHREIYVLTDAEIETATYSNRFAGHVVKQHQFRALCDERGWRYSLQGAWDSWNTPTLPLPQWGDLEAQFIVEPIMTDDDQSDLGVYLYLTTDQVRFVIGDQPVPLRDVPPLAFIEVMRDVDLFVAVTSVAADPEWRDRGELGGFGNDYWSATAFGELSATARTRREVLERLVPRLKIAERCSFDERFLVVRGDLHTYKIHLGSGNILIEPGSRYLCIVRAPPTRGAEASFLPFEGDALLSIILSKAFLLADDAKIDDPAITSQL